MPYNTYAESVSTTPVTIFDLNASSNPDKGRGPRGVRVWCTDADVRLEFHGAIPDAANDFIVVTDGDTPKEIVFTPTDPAGISVHKIVASTASGTASLNVETFAY